MFSRRKNFFPRIAMQQLVPAVAAKRSHQRVIHFDKAAIWTAKKQSLLNVVEKLPIPAFGLAAVGNVFQYVDGLQSFAAGRVYLGSGNKERPLHHRMNVLIPAVATPPPERSRSRH